MERTENRETAFGALVVLLAESIPLGRAQIAERAEQVDYTLTFPWATLLQQSRVSLAKLIETADMAFFSVEDGAVKIVFSLRRGA